MALTFGANPITYGGGGTGAPRTPSDAPPPPPPPPAATSLPPPPPPPPSAARSRLNLDQGSGGLLVRDPFNQAMKLAPGGGDVVVLAPPTRAPLKVEPVITASLAAAVALGRAAASGAPPVSRAPVPVMLPPAGPPAALVPGMSAPLTVAPATPAPSTLLGIPVPLVLAGLGLVAVGYLFLRRSPAA